MSGLECSEIHFSECNQILDFRIDATTYKKDYITTDRVLKKINAVRIEQIISSIQNFGAYSLCNSINFVDNGIPFLMTQNVRTNYIDWENIRCVDKKSHEILYKSHCRKGQVLITMAGEYLGRAAVYDSNFVCSSNQAIAKLTVKCSPYYLSLYINSKYGQNQINRFKTITGQPNINMTLIKYLLVPLFSDAFTRELDSYSVKALHLFDKANGTYHEAQSRLLSVLVLNTFSPSNENTSVKHFSEIADSGRLDAEYYQKKYDDLFEAILNAKENPNVLKVVCLSDVVSIKKSIEPGSDEYMEEGIPFIRVADVSKHEVQPPNIFLDRQIFDIEELKPKKDTILLSKDGSVGIAYKAEQDMDAITSGALLHLNVMDKEVNPDYLTLLLNSFLVGMQAERDVGGSILKHWRVDEIKNVILLILQEPLQQEIAEKVRQSFALREQSKALLKAATRAVEIAIEQDEAAGMEFLHKFSS